MKLVGYVTKKVYCEGNRAYINRWLMDRMSKSDKAKRTQRGIYVYDDPKYSFFTEPMKLMN